MRFNILHHLFRAKVDSDAVTSDGYEVTNLVSPNFRERSKGFLAANFVKTPVQILFQFPFAINLEKVIVNPMVGSQISSGFEILAAGTQNLRHKTADKSVSSSGIKRKSNTVHAIRKKRIHVSSKQAVKHSKMETNREESRDVGNPSLSFNCDSSLHAYEYEITCLSAKTEHRSHFVSVAHVFTDTGTPFMICNTRFCERQSSQSMHLESTKPGKDVYNFRNMHKLQVVTHLIVRIIRIFGSSVPGLKNIEIWGQPVRNCPQETIDLVTRIQMQIDEENEKNFHDHQLKKLVSKSENNVSNTIDLSSVDIPQEFIDPITCSIMTIPILLPSGHNVDSTTLEKHVESEKGWGRAASDPFTGINFSDNYRPLPNSSLKVRIDRFLLLSNLNVQNLGRTVGRDTSTVNTNHSNNIQKNGYKLDAPTLQGLKGSADGFQKTLHADDVKVVTKADSGKKSDNKLGTKSRRKYLLQSCLSLLYCQLGIKSKSKVISFVAITSQNKLIII